jgi:hypothetical protein
LTPTSSLSRLTATDADEYDSFGENVAISGNIALIGAPGISGPPDGNPVRDGSAYVFYRNSSGWSESFKIFPNDFNGSNFGRSVAISGDTALVGAYTLDGSGSVVGIVYVFVRSGDRWLEQATFKSGVALFTGSGSDSFGLSVAISGDTAIVGAPSVENDPNAEGVAIYVRNGTSWSKASTDQSLIDANSDFGWSVAISGENALVGAPAIKNPQCRLGSAYILARNDDNIWVVRQALASLPNRFGYSVALSGAVAVVGRPQNGFCDHFVSNAYIYVQERGWTWRLSAEISSLNVNKDEKFGLRVAVSDGRVLVGAPGPKYQSRFCGKAYTFERSCSGLWFVSSSLSSPATECNAGFGWGVAIDGDIALVGAPDASDASERSGTVYAIPQAQVPCDVE